MDNLPRYKSKGHDGKLRGRNPREVRSKAKLRAQQLWGPQPPSHRQKLKPRGQHTPADNKKR